MTSTGRIFRIFKPLYILLTVFITIVTIEAVYLGVGMKDIPILVSMIEMGIAKILGFMLLLAVITFLRLRSYAGLKERAKKYLVSETFASALAGAFLLMFLMVTFIVHKGFMPKILPYTAMRWDMVFADIDKWLHFGYYPHEFLVPVAEAVPYFSDFLDRMYASWVVVLYLVVGYCLYCDRDILRKMRFIWSYFLLFIIAGGILALVFISLGPTFWETFYKDVPNPYEGLMQHLAEQHRTYNLWFYGARHWIIGWVNNDRLIDFNSISAMPSLHNGSMLLMLLYIRHVSRVLFYSMFLMTVLVFVATVYSGLHFAIDAYVAYLIVIPIWWGSKKIIDRFYKEYQGRDLTI